MAVVLAGVAAGAGLQVYAGLAEASVCRLFCGRCRLDAIRAAQAFVRFEIERTPDESDHVYTYACGHFVLTALADTVAREALTVGDRVQEFLKASPDLGALMKADKPAETPA